MVPVADAPRQPLKRAKLYESVYELLRQEIIDGRLAPGEKLNIFSLAAQLGVSRTPIKDAFNRLTLEGLLTVHPQSGTFVTKLTENRIRQVFEVRLMIELWAVRRARSEQLRTLLRQATEILRACDKLFADPERFDFVEFAARDRQFHTLVVDLNRNEELKRIYEAIYPQIHLLRVYWGRARARAFKSHQQHLAVRKAIRSGSIADLESALEAHITSSMEDILSLLASPGNLDPAPVAGARAKNSASNTF